VTLQRPKPVAEGLKTNTYKRMHEKLLKSNQGHFPGFDVVLEMKGVTLGDRSACLREVRAAPLRTHC
jgi:hypothetical protein